MEFPKPLARLLNANDLTEKIIQKGYPHLKMWRGMLEAAHDEIKKKLVEWKRPVDLTETTELCLVTSTREIFGKPENAPPEVIEELKRLGCFRTIPVTAMVERTKK